MSWKQLVVCPLVFAAGATFSLAGIRSIPQLRLRASSLPHVRLINSSHPQARTMPADSPLHAPDLAVINRIANLPLTFEPNEGQTDANVKFIGRGMGLTVLLTPEGMTIRTPRSSESSASPKVNMRWREVPSGKDHFEWSGEQRLPGETNYLLGHDRSKWRTHVPHFAQLDASTTMPGVDMVVYGNAKGVEYDLRLAPGTDASKLRLDFSEAQKLRLDARGNLLIGVGDNEIRMKRPAIYEETLTHARRPVAGGYVIEADNSIGFQVAAHNPNLTLVIDPSLSVAYSTFLGGLGNDVANSVSRDSAGNIYVGGTTDSAATFPESGLQAIGQPGSGTDFFIAKLNPLLSGPSSLVYLTFLGGSGNEAGGLLAVDSSGDVAITGTTTSPDFPVTDSSVPAAGANSLAVSEINPAGNSLLFSTLFGGNGQQSQFLNGGLALGPTGNIFVAADTTSTNLPVTAGAFQLTLTGNQVDGFLAVFQPGASPNLIYCTYLGVGANEEMGVGGVAVDAAGNAFVAGYTSSFAGAPFPAKNAFQSANAGGPFDSFLMKLSPSGQGASDLVYATLLGGSGLDKAFAVAVDSQNPPDAYVAGTTQSADFPVTSAGVGTTVAFQANLHSSATANAFLAVIAQSSSTGMTSLMYSSYLGGSVADSGQSIAVVSVPNQVVVSSTVYIAGAAGSWDFPWHDNFQPFNGTSDAFVAKFTPALSGSASLIYSTPLGGTDPPGGSATAAANGISTDSAGHVYVVGQTTAADFPTAGNPGTGVQMICGSCQQSPAVADAFLVAINENSTAAASVSFTVPHVSFSPSAVGTVNVPQFVGIVNSGEAPLHIFSLNLIGPNASDFSLIAPSACTAAPISPGAFCSFEVGFDPSVATPEGAAISFSDDATGTPQVLELIGQGGPASQPLAVPVPTGFDFGSVSIGKVSVPATITLQNKGVGPLDVSSVTLAGADKLQFTSPFPADTCVAGAVIQPLFSCALSVTFSPIATGTFHAQIQLVDNSGGLSGAMQIVLLTGKGTLPAAETISPPALDFGTSSVGTSSAAQTVTLTSTGIAALSLTGISITGSNAGDFAIVSSGTNPCPTGSGTLATGASCTVKITFSPQSTGAKAAALSFTDNAAASPQTVALSGTAIAAATVQVSPLTGSFAPQSTGTTSAAKQFTVMNTGGSTVSVSITVSGTNAPDFLELDNCTGAKGLASGSSCSVNVSFDPTVLPPSQAARAATMTISYGGAGNQVTVPLSGTATQAGVSFNLTSINFGNQLAGTAGQPQGILATDGGAGALVFSKIAISGANPGDFSETDTCLGPVGSPISISPGGTCSVQVTLPPQMPASCGTAAGSRSATLILTDNAPGSPHTFALSGTETDFCLIPQAGTAPGSISASVPANYNIASYPGGSLNGFAGLINLTCTGAPVGGSCVPAPPSMTLAAGSSAPFRVDVTVATSAVSPRARSKRPTGLPPADTWRLTAICTALAICVGSMWVAMAGLRHALVCRYLEAFALIAAFAIGIAACGGGNSSADPPAPQTYTLALAGTSSCPAASTCSTPPTRTVQLTLTVP